jgi:hypothetical protein
VNPHLKFLCSSTLVKMYGFYFLRLNLGEELTYGTGMNIRCLSEGGVASPSLDTDGSLFHSHLEFTI